MLLVSHALHLLLRVHHVLADWLTDWLKQTRLLPLLLVSFDDILLLLAVLFNLLFALLRDLKIGVLVQKCRQLVICQRLIVLQL